MHRNWTCQETSKPDIVRDTVTLREGRCNTDCSNQGQIQKPSLSGSEIFFKITVIAYAHS